MSRIEKFSIVYTGHVFPDMIDFIEAGCLNLLQIPALNHCGYIL